MIFKTKLGENLYDFAPIYKGTPSLDKAISITKDFCVRQSIDFINIEKDNYNFLYAIVSVEELSVNILIDFHKSFKDMGYDSIGIINTKEINV